METKNLDFLEFSNVKILNIVDLIMLTDISALSDLMEVLSLSGCKSLRQFARIGELMILKKLLLKNLTIEDTSCMTLRKLESLEFYRITQAD